MAIYLFFGGFFFFFCPSLVLPFPFFLSRPPNSTKEHQHNPPCLQRSQAVASQTQRTHTTHSQPVPRQQQPCIPPSPAVILQAGQPASQPAARPVMCQLARSRRKPRTPRTSSGGRGEGGRRPHACMEACREENLSLLRSILELPDCSHFRRSAHHRAGSGGGGPAGWLAGWRTGGLANGSSPSRAEECSGPPRALDTSHA